MEFQRADLLRDLSGTFVACHSDRVQRGTLCDVGMDYLVQA